MLTTDQLLVLVTSARSRPIHFPGVCARCATTCTAESRSIAMRQKLTHLLRCDHRRQPLRQAHPRSRRYLGGQTMPAERLATAVVVTAHLGCRKICYAATTLASQAGRARMPTRPARRTRQAEVKSVGGRSDARGNRQATTCVTPNAVVLYSRRLARSVMLGWIS
jgi:hypothetical protein